MMADDNPDPESRRLGFSRLAARIADWTTRGIVSAMILVAAVAFARQVLRWWDADETDALAPPAVVAVTEALGDPSRPHQLQFGEAGWGVTRETTSGTRQEAIAALRSNCKRFTLKSPLPEQPPTSAEKRLLATFENQSPAEGTSGQWGVFEMEAGFPMTVGVRNASGSGDGLATRGQVVDPSSRVVSWGLALPTGEQTWTLYTFHGKTPSHDLLVSLPENGIPPGGVRTMAVGVPGGGAMVAFKGEAHPEQWKRFFDRRFDTDGWKAQGIWRHRATTWHRRYVKESRRFEQTVEVHFGAEDPRGPSNRNQITPHPRNTGYAEHFSQQNGVNEAKSDRARESRQSTQVGQNRKASQVGREGQTKPGQSGGESPLFGLLVVTPLEQEMEGDTR